MSVEPDISPERLIEIARSRGLAMDAERALAVRPALESLLRRLGQLARDLPHDAAPAPGRVDPNR